MNDGATQERRHEATDEESEAFIGTGSWFRLMCCGIGAHAAFTVILARIAFEARKHYGVKVAKEMFHCIADGMDEAAKIDREGGINAQ